MYSCRHYTVLIYILYLVFTEEPAEGGTPRHCSQSKRKGCVIGGGLYTVYGTATIHGIASIIINVIRVEKQEELLHQRQQAHIPERGTLWGGFKRSKTDVRS